MILKQHTNELLKTVLEEGMDANAFELTRLKHSHLDEIVQLSFKNSPLNFQLYPGNENTFDTFKVVYITFSPTYAPKQYLVQLSMTEVKNILLEWLRFHVSKYIENIDEVDFWQIMKETPLKTEGIDFSKNEPFTVDEQEHLKLGLEEIKILLSKNFGLNEQQVDVTNKKIDYLIAATKRLNKTDWKGITISTIIAIAYDLSFDEQKRSMLYNLFSKLWAFIQHLPGPQII